MPDSVEQNIAKVLEGLPLDGEEAEICDFSVQEQNEALEAQGVQPKVSNSYKPILRTNVTYIVAVVIINENNEVLMMQEAKQSCAGKWYLPAGRVEQGETLCEAAKREVLEETGLEIDCTTLLMVECASGNWVRFVLTGRVTGGSLKTPDQADQESLQAKWVLKLKELTLRSSDILPLIDRAMTYTKARNKADPTYHPDLLPRLKEHIKMLLRLVVVIKKKATNRVHVLISERTSYHLPTCELNPSKSLHATLRNFMVDLFGADVEPHKPHGILSVEYDPRNKCDGLCLTMLVSFRAPLEKVPIIGKCVWHETPKELGDALLKRVAEKTSVIPLNVIR